MSAVFTERLAAADVQFLLLSHTVPNDQFLLYVFDGMPDIPSALAQIRHNAETCDDLRLSVRDDRSWRYPRWVRTGVDAEQFVVHDAVGQWQHCLDSMVRLDHLDVSRMTWRMHVFPPNVVVVQISHALGDGTRSAALAAALFGRRTPLPAVRPARGSLLLRGIAAARAHRGLVRDIEAGLVEPPNPPRPALSVNARSAGMPVLRSFVVGRTRLESPSVTVAALSSIGAALGGYLAGRGEDVSRLAAEVPMAGAANAHVRNNFRNVTVGLYPDLEPGRRAARIKADLDAQRRRAGHPAAVASAAAFAAVPAPLLRWGMRHFDPDAGSATVSGHTVVSSVNRGPADLTFGGCPVVLTAGYPALSPMMGLTHGVHGIGDTVAISVQADPMVVDVDDYLDRLGNALGVIRG
ncbi:WS/DGAT domain-containing protein [Mycolicibacterium sp.]|uniref:WS/DGAT domain-containing protein n=1 Tax=Mycolicibacterium sp. TaxID=2320850 RepID=UPI0028B06E13|nr:WS/DGAT domain-containing protein [Mycolicibacterium sp.]